MSVYYDFFAEAYYNGKWYNIDFFTMGQTGKLKHQYLYTVSRSFLGRLSTVIDHAVPLKFEDLAEGTRKILREDAQPQSQHPQFLSLQLSHSLFLSPIVSC